MNTARKARWAVRQSALPTVVKPCLDCGGTRHRPSGKFRVNANGKRLDVWLLLNCVLCDRTSKVPVHERTHVSSLEPARLTAYESNDPTAVGQWAMSAALAAKNAYRLDWTGTWHLLTDAPLHEPDAPAPLMVTVGFELPAPVRVERLLTLGLGVSRTEVRRMLAAGRIQLPMAPGARTRRDFEFTVERGGTAGLAADSAVTVSGAPRRAVPAAHHASPRASVCRMCSRVTGLPGEGDRSAGGRAGKGPPRSGNRWPEPTPPATLSLATSGEQGACHA
ncbi:DUF1062 domain-containing protein [Streptomyces sp. NPDC101225]|uniref:DUF1062 domain-containing protein n=1 Tax=Streptomyces sp. NPDC101225 TaxID=3366135 RepID=UPI0038249B22